MALDRRRNGLTTLLSGGFGLGSWIAMTGLWVELPLLVQHLPEGWSLAASLSLVLQIANVGPVAYGILNRWWPNTVTERSATHWQMGIGSVSTLLLVFLWSETVGELSLALYVLSFGLSLVDCTSSVVFLPYMARLKPVYLTPYLVGEGMSGLLPSLVAMAQGIDDSLSRCTNHSQVELSNQTTQLDEISVRFQPEWFFVFLLALLLFSWLSFGLLDNLSICKKEMIQFYDGVSPTDPPMTEHMIVLRKATGEDHEMCELSRQIVKQDVVIFRPSIDHPPQDSSTVFYYYLLFLQGWASVATFGVFPAIQTYSCLPYGDRPFHMTVTLCGIVYPVACLAGMFLEVRSAKALSALTLAATVLSAYAMCTAIMSPEPPLLHSVVGPPLIVACWVSFMGLFSYVKTMATVSLGDGWGSQALFWCGAVTQGGAALGALLMFLLVNLFNVFQDDGLCID